MSRTITAGHPRKRRATFSVVLLLVGGLLLSDLVTASAKGPGRILVIESGIQPGVTAGSLNAIGYSACGSGNCYDVVGGATLATFTLANWSPYSVLYVGWGPVATDLAALQTQAGNINAWISDGGSVVASSASGGYGWLPDGNQFSVAGHVNNSVQKTALGNVHPAFAGVTDADLSNWSSSTHTRMQAWPGYLQTLSKTAAGYEITLAGHYGNGCILVTGQDIDWHANFNSPPGARTWLKAVIPWAYTCECFNHSCEPRIATSGIESPSPPDDIAALLGLAAEPARPPTYFLGPVTVDVSTCRCIVTQVSLTSTVLVDQPIVNDGLFPTLTQTSPFQWVVTSPDVDTYLVTFTLTLQCPTEDGAVETKTVSKTWIMGP